MSSTANNIKSILEVLPHKLQVEFAVYCCNDIRHLITDKASINALRLVEKWLKDDTSVTTKELIDAIAAFNFGTSTAIYTYTAAAAAAIAGIPAASPVYYIAAAATYAAEASGDKAVKLKQYETHLANKIANLSILEKLIYNINIENKEK